MIYNNLGQSTEGRLVYLRSTDIEQRNWSRLLWSFPDEALYLMSRGEEITIRDLSKKERGKIERIFTPVMRDVLNFVLFGRQPENRALQAHYTAALKCLENDNLLYTKYAFWKDKIPEVRLSAITQKVDRESNPLYHVVDLGPSSAKSTDIFEPFMPNNNFRPKRVDWFYDVCNAAVNALTRTIYSVDFVNTAGLASLKDSGFVLIPKHQSALDVPLEGWYLREALGRRAYYVMKSSVNFRFLLERLGGIPVKRRKELIGEFGGDQQLVAQGVESQVAYLDDAVTLLLDAGEIVVNHVEGTRRPGLPFAPKNGVLERLVRLKTKADPIFVPMNMTYSPSHNSRQGVTVYAGTPIQTRDAKLLEGHLKSYIP